MLPFGLIPSIPVLAFLELPSTCKVCLASSEFVYLILIIAKPADELSASGNSIRDTVCSEETLGKQSVSVYQAGRT